MDAKEAFSRAIHPDAWAVLDRTPANEREKEIMDLGRAFFIEEADRLFSIAAEGGHVVAGVNEPIDPGKMQIVMALEADGRWIAEIPAVPGAMAYGSSPEHAMIRALSIAKESTTGAADGI